MQERSSSQLRSGACDANMGQSGSKNPKTNKNHNRQKMFRIGISVGRNDLNVEGHLQMGYSSKTIKNYNKPIETQPVQTQLVETQPVQTREEPSIINMLVSFNRRSLNLDDYLASVYYDLKRSGGFGGVDRLYKDVKKEGKFNINRSKIKEWLMKQDAYTLHKPIRRRFRKNRGRY